jgi:hypothetical protein
MRENPGKSPCHRPGKFPTMHAITAFSVADAVRCALRSSTGFSRHAAKSIAARVGTTPRTVEDWLQGENAPQAAQLIRLIGEFDEVYEAVMELAGRPTVPAMTPAKQAVLVAALKVLEGE